MEWNEYQGLVVKLLGALPQAQRRRLAYFHGHAPRFRTLTDMMRACFGVHGGGWEPVRTVLDAGTEFPFASLYLQATQQSWVLCGGMGEATAVAPTLWYAKLNLCHPPAMSKPIADLAICTEVLEHLPCNVFAAIDWLKSTTRKWLLLSFPQGGGGKYGAHGYARELPEPEDAPIQEHLREFNSDTTRQMIDYTGWVVEDMRNSDQPAYAAPIVNVMLRRP